ncbi:hypothetical protein T484DRAFT_1780138 [Baffinella frigidus]|nr:hypothetical protein T484DRAFT_1780138 [Cryptophyta sp. CCMP2293]
MGCTVLISPRWNERFSFPLRESARNGKSPPRWNERFSFPLRESARHGKSPLSEDDHSISAALDGSTTPS